MKTYREYTGLSASALQLQWKPLEAGQLSAAVHLDTNGAVVFPGGMMHPKSFRDICGEQAYQELLARPRVQSEYTAEELAE